jgi:hypothetical protein
MFKSSLLISKEDGNCDFVVSYLFVVVVVAAGGQQGEVCYNL